MADVKKLVVVDDDPDLLSLIKSKLEKTERYKVVTTTEGSEAVRLATQESPDLIILDIDMPDMDGGEVAKSLSESEYTKDIPILFLSVLVSKVDVAETGDVIGGHHMISKSMGVENLIIKIESLLE